MVSIPITVITGIALGKASAPYLSVLVTVHQFASIAIVVSLGLLMYRFLQDSVESLPATALRIFLLMLILLAFSLGAVATIVTGERKRVIFQISPSDRLFRVYCHHSFIVFLMVVSHFLLRILPS